MAGLRGFRMALIQLAVGADKAANLQRASEMVKKAAERGASLVSLPECFNCPYGTQYFAKYAETVPGETTGMLSRLAKELKIYLIGGSIPERSGELLYNCSTVFGPDGTMLAKFRKMHLFDIDVPGKIRFQESEVLTGGNEFCTFDTEWCKVGLAICYDVRFSELASIYAQKGCKLMCFPGAFNLTTGPVHWKLLLRARSLDHQVYVAGISPARDDNATYVAWGNSMLVSPWGQVVTEADEKETILYGDVDLDYLDEVRAQVPIRNQKRTELYTLPATK